MLYEINTYSLANQTQFIQYTDRLVGIWKQLGTEKNLEELKLSIGACVFPTLSVRGMMLKLECDSCLSWMILSPVMHWSVFVNWKPVKMAEIKSDD